MYRKALVTFFFILLSFNLIACNGKRQKDAVNTSLNNTDIVTDENINTFEEAAVKTPEEEIAFADSTAQKLIFEDKADISSDLGTYVKTLGGYVFDGVEYKDKPVKAIELFWQCKNSKASDYSVNFSKEQWAVVMYYDHDELIGFEAFPCEYSMVTAALASIKLMNNEEGVNLLYDTYIDNDYSSIVSRDEHKKIWHDLTDKLGNYVQIKSLVYGYNYSYTYPYVSALIEFEKGTALQSYYYKPGSIKAYNVITREYDAKEIFAVNSIVSKEAYEVDPEWQKQLKNFKESSFDLTAALTAPSLKDLCSDYFKLGAALTGSAFSNCAIHSPEYMTIIKKHFNSTTLTNLMKPAYILDQAQSIQNASLGIADPALKFDTCDEVLAWCMENGVKMRGHTLVWHAQTPEWFFKEGYKDDGALVDRQTMLYRLESYIRQYMTYVQENYPGVVYCWDVVNEAVEPSSNGDPGSFFYCRKAYDNGKPNLWYQTLGQDYVEMAFTYARKYAADGVKLFYNDYNTFMQVKRDNIYKLCDYLKSKGLIDGIGMQGYYGISSPSLGEIKNTINKYAELGLELQITELSIDAANTTPEAFEAQGIRYASIMRLLQSLDTAGGGKANITCVTFFGLMDGFLFYSNDTSTSRLFDKALQPKPAFNKILETFEIFY